MVFFFVFFDSFVTESNDIVLLLTLLKSCFTQLFPFFTFLS